MPTVATDDAVRNRSWPGSVFMPMARCAAPEGWRFVVMRAGRPPCRPGMAARPVAQTCDGQWLATVKSLARDKGAREVPMATQVARHVAARPEGRRFPPAFRSWPLRSRRRRAGLGDKREAGMATGDQHGASRTVVLPRQSARIAKGQPEGGYTAPYEIVRCDCGDHPDLDYREVSLRASADPRARPDRGRRCRIRETPRPGPAARGGAPAGIMKDAG